MHLYYRNVNDAFLGLVQLFHTRQRGVGDVWQTHGDPAPIASRPSRNGPVLLIDEPVTITYEHPRERVLLNPARDANPFFHLFESLYMLSGGNYIEPLAYYASKMRDFSDDGVTQNGAYGFRWRSALGSHSGDKFVDQLDLLVSHLRADPASRRAVLQMWTVEDDLLKIGQPTTDYTAAHDAASWGQPCPLEGVSKDVCCNLSVMFSLRDTTEEFEDYSKCPEGITTDRVVKVLDMTVTNRSNDLVWGALGANYVHFTVLQEYMAARLGVEVGRYHHVSNNLHVYEWNWKPKKWLEAEESMDRSLYDYSERAMPPAPHGPMKTVPLVRDPALFDDEVKRFVETHGGPAGVSHTRVWSEPFLRGTAEPMLKAFHLWKKYRDGPAALAHANLTEAEDWRLAAAGWLQRRIDRAAAKPSD